MPSATPIVPSSAFQQPDAATIAAVTQGTQPGYVYGRYHNPTVEALEETVADLEGAESCAAYSSGMSAIAGAFAAADLPRGAKILAARDLYGTTIIWLEDAASKNDWQIIYVDFCDRPFATGAIRDEKPSMVYVETLSNPLVRVVDLDAIGPASRDAGAILVVDATFTPPSLLRPIEHGATLVAHSATKYLGGHGDLVGGVLSGPASLIEKARARRTLDGTIVDPFTAWLILRGLKTLPLRGSVRTLVRSPRICPCITRSRGCTTRGTDLATHRVRSRSSSVFFRREIMGQLSPSRSPMGERMRRGRFWMPSSYGVVRPRSVTWAAMRWCP